MLYQYYGEDWMQNALDSDSWNTGFTNWLTWRKSVFNRQRYRHKESKFSLIDALEDLMIDEVSSGLSSSDSSNTDSSSSTNSSRESNSVQ